VTCVMGFWHIYKHASKSIYEIYANSFIAGCFLTLFPAAQFRARTRYLSSIVTVLSYIRLSYPMFRDQLIEALDDDDDDMFASSKIHLNNLQALCEYIIPAVTYIFILVSRSHSICLCIILFGGTCSLSNYHKYIVVHKYYKYTIV
jgi:hypothetical protein